MLAKLNLYGLSLDFLSMKGVHVANELDIRFPMRRKGPQILLAQDVHPDSLAYQHLWNLPGRPLPLAVDRSDPGLEGFMEKLFQRDSKTQKHRMLMKTLSRESAEGIRHPVAVLGKASLVMGQPSRLALEGISKAIML